MASGEPPPPDDPSTSAASSSGSKVALRKPMIALPKGKACLECRKRKVKCDAQSPCTGCIRMRKECVYEEEHERIVRLQGTVAKLEQRLKKLLSDPEIAAAAECTATSTEDIDMKGKGKETSPETHVERPRFPSAEFTFTMPSAVDDVEPPDLSGDWWKMDMPPPHIQMHLIQIFFDTSRTGYTVHKPRFFKSLNLPPKIRPHPCLLNVMFLIACHHSRDPLLTVHQDVFLARTRKHLQASLTHRDRLLHFLSGSTLLGYYFLKSGRFLEASYQISGAARFAVTCNLHKMSSAVWKPPPTVKKGDPFSSSSSSTTNLTGGINLTPLLPPPIDAVDVGERINLFWMIVLVDHSASLITGLPSSIDFDNIQTVWPRAIEDYESGAANGDKASVESLFDKSAENRTAGLSEMSLLKQTQTKAIVLLERVVKFSNWGKGISPDQLQGRVFTTTFRSLYDALTRHLAATPPLNIVTSPTVSTLSPTPDTPKTPLFPRAESAGLAFARAPSTARSDSAASSTAGTSVPAAPPRFILVHVYGIVSYIHLYDALCRDTETDTVEMVPGSYQDRLEMARRALKDIRALKASGTDFKKHLMMQGFAWGVVARVFAQHVRRLQKEFGQDDPRVREAIEELADVVNPIRTLASVFPILEFQLDRLRVYEIPIPGG